MFLLAVLCWQMWRRGGDWWGISAGIIFGLFLGNMITEHMRDGRLNGVTELGEQLRGTEARLAAKDALLKEAVEGAVAKALRVAEAGVGGAVAATPCPACPVCPPAATTTPPHSKGSKAVLSKDAAAGVGVAGAAGTPINFASPFANQPGLIHKFGCRVVAGDGEVQCTDKVGGNTPDHQFVRDAMKGLEAPHGYDRWYEPMFRHLRQRKIRLLEIGMKDGASAHLWTKYFPYAEVYGLDYDTTQTGAQLKESKDGVRVVIGDQGSEEDLARLVEQTGGNFDIIIDDGGHAPTQQLVSFDYLFRHALRPGGIYSVEDIETSYWTNAELYSFVVEGGLHKYGTAIEVFKQIADSVNRVYMPNAALPPGIDEFNVFKSGVDALVDSIQFTANCVLMTKKGVWGSGWDTRDQTNMAIAHRMLFDSKSGETMVLGDAVDSIDKDRDIQKRLLNAHMLPTAY